MTARAPQAPLPRHASRTSLAQRSLRPLRALRSLEESPCARSHQLTPSPGSLVVLSSYVGARLRLGSGMGAALLRLRVIGRALLQLDGTPSHRTVPAVSRVCSCARSLGAGRAVLWGGWALQGPATRWAQPLVVYLRVPSEPPDCSCTRPSLPASRRGSRHCSTRLGWGSASPPSQSEGRYAPSQVSGLASLVVGWARAFLGLLLDLGRGPASGRGRGRSSSRLGRAPNWKVATLPSHSYSLASLLRTTSSLA